MMFPHPYQFGDVEPHHTSPLCKPLLAGITFMSQPWPHCLYRQPCQCSLLLVFKSLVKSGFLTQKWATVDRNQSKPLPILRGPQPNQRGPVLFGSVAPKRPVSTAIRTVYMLYYGTTYQLMRLPCKQVLAGWKEKRHER
jgi:hypothetical protein